MRKATEHFSHLVCHVFFSFHNQREHGSDENGRERGGVVANKQGVFHVFTSNAHGKLHHLKALWDTLQGPREKQ